jgi:pseudouridine-5'-phosphate glycosidase/pseudouridine kinase
LATLLAVPPLPSTTGDKVQEAVEQAVRESREQGIDKRGKEATPWLLKRVGELSGGQALDLSTLISTFRAFHLFAYYPLLIRVADE